MKREKDDIKTEEIKKNANFKIITLMIDYLDSLGFDINSSPYKKTDYSLSSNYRIHSFTIPENYIQSLVNSVREHLDFNNVRMKNLFNSMNGGILNELEIDLLGEIYLQKAFNITLS